MTDNFIQLNKNDLLILKIKDADGVDTGEELVFDLDDIELPIKYQDMLEKIKKCVQNTRNQLQIIDKKEDHKGKKLMSANEEAKVKVLIEFFKKMEEYYDIFLGKGGVKKLLCGRKLGWTSFEEIDDIIENQIAPQLKVSEKSIQDKIKKKYGQMVERGVLE